MYFLSKSWWKFAFRSTPWIQNAILKNGHLALKLFGFQKYIKRPVRNSHRWPKQPSLVTTGVSSLIRKLDFCIKMKDLHEIKIEELTPSKDFSPSRFWFSGISLLPIEYHKEIDAVRPFEKLSTPKAKSVGRKWFGELRLWLWKTLNRFELRS